MKLTVTETNDGRGLYLRVGTSGSKNSIIRRNHAGKTQAITLGAYPALKFEDARLAPVQAQADGHASGATGEADRQGPHNNTPAQTGQG